MPDAWAFARAFQRNCPKLRIHGDELLELARLFNEAQRDSYLQGEEAERAKQAKEHVKNAVRLDPTLGKRRKPE